MFVQLHCVVVDSDVSNRQEMANFLSNHGVNVVAQLPTAEALSQVLVRREAAQLVVINLDPNPQESLKRVGQLVRQFPNTSFFVMSQTVDAQLLMEAMHMGIREFVPLPIVPEKFAAGIERVASQFGMGKRARMVQVIPTIGGCGSTTVACNVATALARESKTVLLDMDLVLGTVASSFDVRPKYTIADIMNSAERLDNQLLDNALAIHEASSLAILARPDLPEDSGPILAIVSVKFADAPAPDTRSRSIAAIGIELYGPLPGGVAVGGRFAPDAIKVRGLREIEIGTAAR